MCNADLVLIFCYFADVVWGQQTTYVTGSNITISYFGSFKDGPVQLAIDNSNTTCAVGKSSSTTLIAFQFPNSTFTVHQVVIITRQNVPVDMYQGNYFTVQWGFKSRYAMCTPSRPFSATSATATYSCPGDGSILVISQNNGKVLTVCNVMISSSKPVYDTTDKSKTNKIIGIILALMSSMMVELNLCQERMYISDAYVSVTSTGDFRDDDVSLAYDYSNMTCAVGHSEQTTSIMFGFKGPRFAITSVCIVTSPNVGEDKYDTNLVEVSWGTEERMMECIASSSAGDGCTYTCLGSGSNLVIAQNQGKVLSVCNVIITRHVDDDMDPCDDTYNPNNYVGMKRCSSLGCHAKGREELMYMAVMAKQSKRFEDMACVMKKIMELEERPSRSELILLFDAFMEVHKEILTAWKSIGFDNIYKLKFESELDSVCNDILQLVNDRLIPLNGNQRDTEIEVILLTTKGTFQAYLRQLSTASITKAHMASSFSTFTNAAVYAKKLRPRNDIRLLFTVQFSTFYILIGEISNCCKLLQAALSDAKGDLMDDIGIGSNESLGLMMIQNIMETLSCVYQPEDIRMDL